MVPIGIAMFETTEIATANSAIPKKQAGDLGHSQIASASAATAPASAKRAPAEASESFDFFF